MAEQRTNLARIVHVHAIGSAPASGDRIVISRNNGDFDMVRWKAASPTYYRSLALEQAMELAREFAAAQNIPAIYVEGAESA